MLTDHTYEVQFFSEGFFGYGEKGDFQYFTIWHFLPIILLIAGIILTYRYRDKIRESKHEKTFRLILGTTMMIVEMSYFWRLLYIGSSDLGEPNLLSRLPFQICEWSCIFAVLMVLTENRTFFDIDVIICLTFGLLPLLLPAVIQRTGPTYYRYYQFWGEHILPIYSVFYMMFVKGFRYNVKKAYKALIFLIILGIICIYLNNRIPTGTYMYLQGNDLGDAITSHLPKSQYGRLAILIAVEAVLAGIEFLIFHFIYKKEAKQPAEMTLQH